jgi:hypothetical protein
MREVQRFADNSGYCVILEVRSRGYQVRAPFTFEPWPLDQFITQLEHMDQALEGSAKLQPLYERHSLELTLTHTGCLVVHGEVFEDSEYGQHLTFRFATDQTVLKPLIRDLKACRELAAA